MQLAVTAAAAFHACYRVLKLELLEADLCLKKQLAPASHFIPSFDYTHPLSCSHPCLL
jgi:hypothetical protein